MALTTIPGVGLWMPEKPMLNTGPAFTASLIDATGEKVAIIGRVFNKDRTSKTITKVGFLPGAVTSAGGSGLILSLQDVSAASGPPYQPDETQDQTVAFLASALTANTWFQTAALSATRAVAFGELLAVVIEYDGSGRLGSDAVNINGLTLATTTSRFTASGMPLKTGGTWASQNVMPNVILEFDDGTFGTLDYGWPASATSNISYNNVSAADEVAMEFTLPFPCTIDGIWLMTAVGSSAANFDVVLYKGTSAQATVSFDANAIESTNARILSAPIPAVNYAVGDTFRLALKPTTGTSSILYYFDVSAANHFQAHAGGTTWAYTSRVSAGAWAAVTATRRPYMGIRISALDTGGGSSGGISRARGFGGFS